MQYVKTLNSASFVLSRSVIQPGPTVEYISSCRYL